MLTFKLIGRNVRRSIRDYAIYFLTLALGVSLFYAFNSISSQPALHDLNYAMEPFGDALTTYIGLLSKFIVVILAFLILYANQFIMKRRKKELGIYMSLGMNKWKISSIFVGETFLVGIFALIVGLGIGLLLSQGISILALKMFVGDASDFQLMFSIMATKETILYFAAIFIVVMIFNTRTIISIQLIELLTASRKNQELKSHSKKASLVLFFLSLVSLIIGTVSLLRIGLEKEHIGWITGLLGIGIVLFYYTLSSVMILLAKRNTKMYFNNLNVFLFRQLGSKMQTNVLVMIVLCGLLLSSLVVLGTGFSITSSMNKQAVLSTPFDLTIVLPFEENPAPLEKAQSDGIPLKENLSDYAETILYETDLTYGDLFKDQKLKLSKTEQKMMESHITFISETDYNKQMALSNQKQIQLGKDEYYINANYERTEKNLQHFLENDGKINLGGNQLVPVQKKELQTILYLTASTVTNNMGTIIVSDEVAQTLQPESYLLNGKFSSKDIEARVYEVMNNKWIEESLNGSIFYVSRSVTYDSYFGTFGVIAFICSYLGIVLMIVTLSVLALKQLTETQDNKERYQTLAKIGADNKMINKTLFRQIGVYFAAPLLLAGLLSVFVTKVLLEKLEPFFQMSIGQNMVISFVIILLLYGLYFIATYQSAKQIIIEAQIK